MFVLETNGLKFKRWNKVREVRGKEKGQVNVDQQKPTCH
jgi:hypothetical protein